MLTLDSIIKIIKHERSSFRYENDLGWNAYFNGEPYRDDANVSWQTGWLDAQDRDINNQTVIQPNS